ncbi:MAG TPA: hypothetical protein VJN89_20450 [Candidatus Acidoferrum sp.]|nr:hypothetical protein [Candidatus Acidoferrum sp.]
MNTLIEQNSRLEAPQHDPFSLGTPSADNLLSTAVICLMLAVMLALFQFPMHRIFANVQVNYNEGWNAYRDAQVAKGVPLYRTPPQGLVGATAYPPISFHLVSGLGNPNTFTVIGRLVSLFSLLVTGVFVALIVKQGGGSRLTAIFSFLLYEIGIALLRADRIGMNDPQLLGEAFSAAGLYFYVRNPNSKRLLWLSAFLFCLAGFTKPNLIAFPAAVAIDLLVRSRRSFLTWAGAMLLSAGILTAVTVFMDGRYFLSHLMGGGGRAYSYHTAWSQFHHYVERFQCLLVIATAWSVRAFRSRSVFASAFVLAHGLAFLLGGGNGVDLNIFFNGLAATVIVCGLALSDLSPAREPSPAIALLSQAAMMFALFFISIMIFVPGQLRRDRQQMRLLSVSAAEFDSAVSLLKANPGPAMCESILLCYEAGKPLEFEAFAVREQVRTGATREADVLDLLRSRHFRTVQIELRSDEENLGDTALRTSLASDQKDPDTERRFSPAFMNELLRDYHLSLRTSAMAVFSAN